METFLDRMRALLSTPGRRWAAAGGAAALLVAVVGVAAFAGGGGGDEPTTLPTTDVTPGPTGTTAPDGTTTVPPSLPPATATTITAAGFSLSLVDAPDGFDEAVAAFYQWVAGLEDEVPAGLPDGLVAHLEGVEPVDALDLEGEVSWAFLRDRGTAAVALVDGDVVLGADDGDGWRIVGARLDRFDRPAWYGGSPRIVLVIGSDANWLEDVFKKNADSVQILTAVPEQGAGAIVGIPRDAWVDLPDGSQNKLTNTLPGGGPEGVLEVVRNLTGLPIEGYIVTGYIGFEQVARGLGAFPITLDAPVRGGSGEGGTPGFPDFPAGTQTLTAEDLLLYLRIRKTLPNGDFDRVANAGMVTQEALKQAQSRGMADLPLLLSILTGSTHNNLSTEQLVTLGATALDLDPDLVDRTVVPGTVGQVAAASVVFLDPEAAVVFADISDGLLDGS